MEDRPDHRFGECRAVGGEGGKHEPSRNVRFGREALVERPEARRQRREVTVGTQDDLDVLVRPQAELVPSGESGAIATRPPDSPEVIGTHHDPRTNGLDDRARRSLGLEARHANHRDAVIPGRRRIEAGRAVGDPDRGRFDPDGFERTKGGRRRDGRGTRVLRDAAPDEVHYASPSGRAPLRPARTVS